VWREAPEEATIVPDVRIIIEEVGGYLVDGEIRLTDDDGRELDLPVRRPALPLRALRKPTVLRWHARRDRLRRNARKLIKRAPQ
jgi:hypothetical protein